MANNFDNMQGFAPPPTAAPPDSLESLVQQARSNPAAFEDYIKRTNPQAYQQALQIRNSANPREIAMQMARSKGINPNILKMLGL